MVPPVQVSLDDQPFPIDTVNLTIPYVPDWPELGALYKTPRVSLVEALQKGAKIVLSGNPGSGKTVALAYLASKIARKSSNLGALENLVPIYCHAADIEVALPISPSNTASKATQAIADAREATTVRDSTDTIVSTLVESISYRASTLTSPRLASYIRSALKNQQLLLLVDGLDELPPDQIICICNFIQTIITNYPQTRIVAAAANENMGTLPVMGFHTYALALWNDTERIEHLEKWNRLWARLAVLSADAHSLPQPGNLMIPNWLATNKKPYTPLEITLTTWAAYAGDLYKIDPHSVIEAYLRRITRGNNKSRHALEQLAQQMIISMRAIVPQGQSGYFFTEGELSPEETTPHDIELSPDLRKKRAIGISGEVINSCLFNTHGGGHLRFVSPVITGYLAAHALLSYGGLSEVIKQPRWSGKYLTLRYYSSIGDAAPAVQHLLKQDDFLHHELLQVARWLSVTSTPNAWRSLVLRALANALQKEKDSLQHGGRIISALALTNEPGVTLLIRQMLKAEDQNLRFLSALASGIIADPKLVDDLAPLTKEKSPSLVRAACLALVAIGDRHAMEIVAKALLQGNEILQRAAAEALANHPAEGYPTLEEASKIENLEVRRAVVYGLMRLHNLPWVQNILRHLQLEDKEWIVRTAAIQAMEEAALSEAHIPKPMADVTEIPWLMDYAAREGIAIADSDAAIRLATEALKKGTEEEKIKALLVLGSYGGNASLPLIYGCYFRGKGDVRDTAYQTLWRLSISSVPLPPPSEFGFN